MNKSLRSYIRGLIIEAMTPPSSAAGEYAIMTNFFEDAGIEWGATEFDFVMYNIESAKNAIQDEINQILADNDPDDYDPNDDGEMAELLADYTGDIFHSAVMAATEAVIRARPPGRYGNCNGAWEVIRSAATGGMGPTLYDIVMSVSDEGLTSDRSSVSDSAKGVWNFYANRRNDVDKAYLDGIGIEVTPHEEDDCELHGARGADMIRGAKSKQFFDWLTSEYEEVQNLLAFGMKEKGEPDWGNDFDVDELMDYVDNFYNYYEDQLEDIDSMLLDLDLDEFRDAWADINWESDNLYDEYPPSTIEPRDAVNLSYNTNYAYGAYESMVDNHNSFVSWCIDKSLDPDFIDESGDDANLIVRDFFNKYH